jgi:phosphatidylglycerophosphate synthase
LRIIGGALVFCKNVLDKVDGSLARLKNLTSRRGRFYDSISDFIVSFFLFTSIGYYFYQMKYPDIYGVYVFVAFITSMLQCSYFIYYEVSFIKYSGKETINRLTETITEDDKINQDKFTTFLQRFFLVMYGWQDYLFLKLDRYLYFRFLKKLMKLHSYPSDIKGVWYYNRYFLTLASSLCIGTHMVLISIFSVFRSFEIYLYINLVVMNIIIVVSIIYHYFSSIIFKKS